MTKDQAQSLLPLMMAFVEGDIIQIYNGDGWFDVPEPNFSPNAIYRVKPKPRRIFVNIYRDGSGLAYDTKLACNASCRDSVIEKTVEFVEVINE